jgi:hypothetical protein
MSFEEWSSENSTDSDGKMKPDRITRLPEISTLFGYGRGGDVKVAIGIELFHNRSKPRTSRWKLELQVANDELAIGFGHIIVPVVNFTIGPYMGYDFEINQKTYGLRFGVFKF